MTKAILPDGRQATYKYDAFGRRIKKTVTDKSGKPTTTEFLWQGDNLIAETDNKDHYQSYIYEPNSFKPLALIVGRGKEHKVYHYQLDHIGTPLDLTNTEGKAVWSAQYLAYGTIYTQHTEEVTNPLRFQGQYFDQETGLHYNRHRYYNPKNGLFTTADPIGLAGGLNNYQYVKNPTGFVEPLGLASVEGACVCSRGGSTNTIPELSDEVQAPNIPGRVDKWSREPKSIQDQMTLKAAQEGQGSVIIRGLSDPNFKGMEKKELKVKSANGDDSVVHYVRDPSTGNLMDFKFKKHSIDGLNNIERVPELRKGTY